MRSRLVMLAGLFCASCPGQYSGLALSDDGGVAYFLSVLTLTHETPIYFEARDGIYRMLLSPTGEVQAVDGLRAPLEQKIQENTWRQGLHLGASGQRVVWTDGQRVYCGSPCVALPNRYVTRVVGTGPDLAFQGVGQLSRNERYLLIDNLGSVSLRDLPGQTSTEVDLVLPASTVSRSQWLTSSGEVIGFTGGNLVLWSSTASRVLARGIPRGVAAVSDNAAVAVYVVGEMLLAIDTRGGRELWSVGQATPAGLSVDGRRLLFLQKINGEQQCFLADLATGGTVRQLTSVPGGVVTATLAGLGKVAAATAARSGDLLSIDVESGAVRTAVAGTPRVTPSLLSPGVVFETSSFGPEPFSGNLLVNGEPAFPLGKGRFQLRWRLVPGSTVDIRTDSESPFSQWFTTVVRDRTPIFTGPTLFVKPGDVVELWGTGLGQVDNPPTEGVLTPQAPLSMLVKSLRCFVRSPSLEVEEAEVLFQGLAPGWLAAYQLNVRIPNVPEPYGAIVCGDSPQALTINAGLVRPAP